MENTAPTKTHDFPCCNRRKTLQTLGLGGAIGLAVGLFWRPAFAKSEEAASIPNDTNIHTKETGAMFKLPPSKTLPKAIDVRKNPFPYKKSENEWKQILSKDQYRVLRTEGTEAPFTSPLNSEKRDGVFHCAGCNQTLFMQAHKYDSGTGWPSFFRPIEEHVVGYAVDQSLFSDRIEVHCGNCGGHLGHVFEDGPQPTGLRYCMNGVAMTFAPKA